MPRAFTLSHVFFFCQLGGPGSPLGGASLHGIVVGPRAPSGASALHFGRGLVLPGAVSALRVAGTEP